TSTCTRSCPTIGITQRSPRASSNRSQMLSRHNSGAASIAVASRLMSGLASMRNPRAPGTDMQVFDRSVEVASTSLLRLDYMHADARPLPSHRETRSLAAPPEVAAGIPAELLRRRPDVRRAEHLAAAQSAQIGVAEAEFYPHISITGSNDPPDLPG